MTKHASHTHRTDTIDPYLQAALSPRQLKRLERKATRQLGQATKNSSLPTNIVDMFKREEVKPLLPKTENQKLLINHLKLYDQIIAIGSAGTGKTFVAAAFAADMFRFGRIKKLVLTRPNVATGKSVGLTPGTEQEKMERWLAPLVAVIKERIGEEPFKIALHRGDIVYQPLETIRGQSYENAFILFDEVQNATKDEILAVVTRAGEGTRIVMTGDTKQTDIGNACGLKFVLDMLKKNETLASMTGVVEFNSDDIVRSGLCKAWIKALEE